MKGDFSNWRSEAGHNFAGVLHQQGRVLLDADWNAQTAIANYWQDTAGSDIIGARVAAVPATVSRSRRRRTPAAATTCSSRFIRDVFGRMDCWPNFSMIIQSRVMPLT